MHQKKKKISRYTVLTICLMLIIASIVSKLIYIQIVKGDEYSLLADKNYIRNISEPARRGNILDCNNKLLATSKNSFNLTYMQTDENEKKFFETMSMVFKILDDNKEIQDDDFALQVEPYKFDFKAVSATDKEWMESRFKKDRGIDDYISKKLYKKKYSELDDDAQKKKVNEQLIKMSAKETFEYLSKELYHLDDKNMSLKEQRRYMIVLDAIRMQSFSGYKPVTIAKNIKQETAFQIYERLSELPGIDIGMEPIRYYPYGSLASSVIGYISKINSINQSKYEEKGYDVNTDLVGTAGIESAFESRLKGSKGQKTVKVNKYGRIVEELFKKNPYPGQNIQLTINSEVQYAAEKCLEDTMKNLRENPNQSSDGVNTSNATRAAAVVINVKNGEVVALASVPQFDPNVFTIPGKLTQETYNKYFISNFADIGKKYIEDMGLATDEKSKEELYNLMFPIDTTIKNNTTIRKDNYDVIQKPTWNYATMSLLPPGSTFKPLTAIAGLEEGVIDEYSAINCLGSFEKYGNTWHCWNLSGHGSENVVSALEESCNVFFYNVGDMLYNKYNSNTKLNTDAYDVIAKYAWKFGLGKATGIEIPESSYLSHPYNLKDSVKNDGALFHISAASILENGYEKGRGYKFQPIDVSINNGEVQSNEVIKIKKEIGKTIDDAISTSPIGKANAAIKYTEQLEKQLTELINTYSKDKKSLYTKRDIKAATEAVINFCIYDANTQLYTPGNVINASIGQGEHQFTPIQLANYIATIANGGTRYELHLFKRAVDNDGNVIEEQQPRVLEKINLKDSTLDIVKKGMKGVTTEGEGTASGVFANFPIVTAGKTGSATFQANQQQFGRTSYAVYVGYAPYDNPEIAVSVVIFDGGHGGYAAPVAKTIYEAYFKEKLKTEYPNYVSQYNYTLQPDKQVSNSIENIDSNDKINTDKNE